MQAQDLLKELETRGTAQNRKVYPRHGVKSPLWGVSFSDLRLLASRVPPDAALAAGLWASGVHDARLLACMVDDPATVSKGVLVARAFQLDNYVLCDALATLVARTPHARELALAWTDAAGEWVASCGWATLAHLALDPDVDDAFFLPFLDQVERHVHQRPNRVRHEMNGALIAIGVRDEALLTRARAVATAIGKVDVDHGETGCKTPDALTYMDKTLAHRAAKDKKAHDVKRGAASARLPRPAR